LNILAAAVASSRCLKASAAGRALMPYLGGGILAEVADAEASD
jgi:hypothetical protein